MFDLPMAIGGGADSSFWAGTELETDTLWILETVSEKSRRENNQQLLMPSRLWVIIAVQTATSGSLRYLIWGLFVLFPRSNEHGVH